MSPALPRLLLVDDDEDLRQMYTLILGKAGMAVETATDGVGGLARIRDGGYDLILLDLMMPTLDGIGVLHALRSERPARPNGPIIVLSNAGYDTVAREAEALGAAGFLMKADLLPKDLVREVKRSLEARTSAKTGETRDTPWKSGRPRGA